MFKSYSSFLIKYISTLRNIALVLVFVLPIIFVTTGLILTTRPVTKESPQYNFIYTFQNNYDSKFNYEIKNNIITKSFRSPAECLIKNIGANDSIEIRDNCTEEIPLYYHNVTTNKSQLITLEEIQNFKLTSKEVSPDGFRFEEYARSYSSILNPFEYNADQRNVLSKNSSVIPQSVEMYQRYTIKFLAWHDNK